MYADPAARGGVLEPEGVVEIKFRKPDLIAAMHRLDPVLQQLKVSHQLLNAPPARAVPDEVPWGSGGRAKQLCQTLIRIVVYTGHALSPALHSKMRASQLCDKWTDVALCGCRQASCLAVLSALCCTGWGPAGGSEVLVQDPPCAAGRQLCLT